MGVNTRNMYSCLQKCNKPNKSNLVGQLLNFKNQSQLLRIQVHCGYHTSLHSSCQFQQTCTHFDDTSKMAAYIIVAFTRYVKDMKELLCNCKFWGLHTGVIVDYGSLRRDGVSCYVAPDALKEDVTFYPQWCKVQKEWYILFISVGLFNRCN